MFKTANKKLGVYQISYTDLKYNGNSVNLSIKVHAILHMYSPGVGTPSPEYEKDPSPTDFDYQFF